MRKYLVYKHPFYEVTPQQKMKHKKMHHHHCHENIIIIIVIIIIIIITKIGTLTAPTSLSGWHSYSASIIIRMVLLQRQKQHHHHHQQGGTLTKYMWKTPSLQNGRFQLNYKLIWHKFATCTGFHAFHPCLDDFWFHHLTSGLSTK